LGVKSVASLDLSCAERKVRVGLVGR